MNLNDCRVVGNLVWEPELGRTAEGTGYVNTSLAINEAYNNSDGKKSEVVTFVDVQVWGKSAESLAQHAKKGEQLFVSGPIRQSIWKDKDTGEKRSKLFIKADSWQFVQYKKASERHAAQAQEVQR